MIWTTGTVTEARDGITIKTVRPPADNLSCEVVIGWKDSRAITEKQRSYAWALIGQVAQWMGVLKKKQRKLNASMKIKFLLENANELTSQAIKTFSLSDCDESTARLYIDFLIDFILQHDIGTKCNLSQMAVDQQRYIYSCLMHKRCAVCGKKSDLHHVERVGMGRNREEIIHEGMEVMPLCREHHIQCHNRTQTAFNSLYHLYGGICADKKICALYRLKSAITKGEEK